MARPLSMETNTQFTKVNVSLKSEIKRFLIDNQISPSDIITRHVENLRELATYRYERIIKEKDDKIAVLLTKIHKIYEFLQSTQPKAFEELLKEV